MGKTVQDGCEWTHEEMTSLGGAWVSVMCDLLEEGPKTKPEVSSSGKIEEEREQDRARKREIQRLIKNSFLRLS